MSNENLSGAPSLPKWDDVWNKAMSGEAMNPLEHLVFQLTPIAPEDERVFRDELLAAIQYACSPNAEAKR